MKNPTQPELMLGVILTISLAFLVLWAVRLTVRWFLQRKAKKTRPFVKEVPKAEWVEPTPKQNVVYPPYIWKNHKHSLKLTGWGSKTKYGTPQNDPGAQLSFTCKDRECGYYAEISRYNYRDLVLDRSNVNQFWPE